MQLNVFSSNITSSAITNAIVFLGTKNLPGSEHIIIVPDRFTLMQEKEVYDTLNLDGSFNIEVMSFSRFADSIISREGNFLSKEGTVMLMKKVLQQNMHIFSYYNKLKVSIGFAREMFVVIAALRSSKITPEMLIKNTSQLEKNKKDKFLDIANIYKLYEKALKSKYNDTISRYEALIELLKTNNKVSQTHFYILGFNAYSKMQVSIIQELCICSQSVTIAAATDSGGANKDIYPSEQIEDIIEFANKNHIKVNQKHYFLRLKYPFDLINKELFAFTEVDQQNTKNRNAVVLFKQKNPYEEIKAVAREIAYLVREGTRYKDIAIVCCNEEYKKCMADIFKRCLIPYFIDEKYSATNSVLSKFIFYLLETALYNYRIDKVLSLIKHPYFKLSFEQADEFENYCLKYNINYSIFTKPFQYNSNADLEQTREKIVDLVNKVVTKGKASLLAGNLLQLVEDNLIIEQSDELFSKASVQAESKIISLIKEVAEIIDDQEMDLEELYIILKEGISSMSIALLPQYMDSVFVGNTSESRFNDKKHLFCVGANEGFFPLKAKEQTILSYSDILSLNSCGLLLRPNPIENNKLEKFVVTDLISRHDNLYVSFSDYNLVGEKMAPGEAVKELSYLLKLSIEDNVIHDFSPEQQLFYNLICAENAYYEYMSYNILDQYRNSVKEYLYEKGYKQRMQTQHEDKTEAVNYADYYFLKDKQNNYITKVSQLESYFCCPFRHFLNYGLKLKEREVAGLRVADVGNIIHEILEIFFKYNLEHIRELDTKEIISKANQAIERVLNNDELKAMNNTYLGENIINNIRKECLYVIQSLMENIKNSSFTPKFIELSFDDTNKEFKAIEIDTEQGLFKLRGKIDRVDLCGNKVAIIDYKTGNGNIAELKNIYYGKKIQLYIYLSVFTENGYRAAGAFYLPINDGYKSKKDRFCFNGQTDKDITTLREFDNKLFDESRYNGQKVDSDILSISASKKKNGIVINKNNFLITEEDFISIIEYVKKLANKALIELSQGYAQQSPLKDECDYCSHKNHCNLNNINKREKESVNIEVFALAGVDNEMD